MKKLLNIIDGLIEKIPPHIRDIIQKAALAVFALVALVAVSISVMRGLNDAQPGGMQVADGTQDLFYLELLREQNKDKAKLLEDVPIEPSEFPSYNANESDPFATFGADRSQNLMGEDESFLNNQDTLRKKQNVLGEPLQGPLLKESESLLLPSQVGEETKEKSDELIPPFFTDTTPLQTTQNENSKNNNKDNIEKKQIQDKFQSSVKQTEQAKKSSEKDLPFLE